MSIEDKLVQLANTKANIKSAIEAKGQSTTGIPFDQYPSLINAIETAGPPPAPEEAWTRPSDWLTLPELTDLSERFVGLFAVTPEDNKVTVTASGNFTVDWGDGVVENFTDGTKAEHEYNYATFDPSNTTLSSRGYKQAIIQAYPQVGHSLSRVSIVERPTGITHKYHFNWLDIAFAGQLISFIGVGVKSLNGFSSDTGFRMLEQIKVYKNSIVNWNQIFLNCRTVQNIPVLWTNLGLSFTRTFSGCRSLRYVCDLNTNQASLMSYIFDYCQALLKLPQMNTSRVTNMASAFSYCASITSVPEYDFSAVTNLSYTFQNCISLIKGPYINAPLATQVNNIFENNYSMVIAGLTAPLATNGSALFALNYCLREITHFDLGVLTSYGNIFRECNSLKEIPYFTTAITSDQANTSFANCHSLTRARINTDRTFSVAQSNLSAAALNEMFTNLQTAVSGAVVTITGCPGAATCDQSIATSKGWTVTG